MANHTSLPSPLELEFLAPSSTGEATRETTSALLLEKERHAPATVVCKWITAPAALPACRVVWVVAVVVAFSKSCTYQHVVNLSDSRICNERIVRTLI